MSNKIRVAIAGVGNCASSLVQGIEYYRDADPADTVPGLMHVVLGGYHVATSSSWLRSTWTPPRWGSTSGRRSSPGKTTRSVSRRSVISGSPSARPDPRRSR